MIATGGRREAKSPARNPCRPHSIRVRACAVPGGAVVGYGVFAIATEYSHGWTWRREKKKAGRVKKRLSVVRLWGVYVL